MLRPRTYYEPLPDGGNALLAKEKASSLPTLAAAHEQASFFDINICNLQIE